MGGRCERSKERKKGKEKVRKEGEKGRPSNQEMMARHTGSEDIQRLPSNNSLGEHQQSTKYVSSNHWLPRKPWSTMALSSSGFPPPILW